MTEKQSLKNTKDERGVYGYHDLRNQEEINKGDSEVIDLDKKEKQPYKFWK